MPGRRKAIRDAGENAAEGLSILPNEVSEEYQLLQSILPTASTKSDARDNFDAEQSRALSAVLLSSSYLDRAKVLSPLLADPRLRKVWSTGNVFEGSRYQLLANRDRHQLPTFYGHLSSTTTNEAASNAS
jgi:hypothetical protein